MNENGARVTGLKVTRQSGGAGFTALDNGQLEPFVFTSFSTFERVRHGLTRRARDQHQDGDMSFVTGGAGDAVLASRRAWAARIGVDATRVVAAKQVHGNRVARVTAADRGRGARAIAEAIPAADALVTAEPGTPLLMCFADCTPLLFHDPARGVVGLAHAGWRGTVADVAGATVRALVEWYGSRPADIHVGIGPAIGPCCYVVGHEVIAAWMALGISQNDAESVVRGLDGLPDQWYFDLPGANRLLLEQAGVPASQIEDAAICTACQVENYFSHRAEQGQAGRFAAIIQATSNSYERRE